MTDTTSTTAAPPEASGKPPIIRRAVPWVLSVWIAFVFIQSLFFKFAGAAESVYIFQTLEDWLGLGFFEPGMRWVIGITELVASVLLFVPGVHVIGAVLTLGVISGAIFFHLFSPLGIEVQGDGGTLFIMAVTVFLSALALIWLRRAQLLKLLGRGQADS